MDASVQKQDNRLFRVRHSLAHVLAQAVLEVRPGSKLGFGPPIDDGLYYDFILSSPLSEEDFPELEKRMRKIIASGAAFVREELPKEDACRRLEEMGEPYKREFAEELLSRNGDSKLSFYRSGPFLDMCDGPHVDRASEIPSDAFKIRSIAGAYWRGDEKNVMMTRIYVWAFGSRDELEKRIAAHELALARDHKKLGRELEIFAIDDDIGRGLPLWLPNGTIIRDELEALMKKLEFKGGYKRVSTPHLAKASLYRKTGHLPYYAEGMYPPMEERNADGAVHEQYYLRPMNCPHHHKVYASRKRSYRDLPFRIAEYGQVYRHEDSGALSGLLRVRGLCQNDAHIYCSEAQAKAELKSVLALYHEVYRIVGLADYSFRLSLSDPDDPKGKEKFVDAPADWLRYEGLLREVLEEEGLPYYEGKGEAAFYGPKIDIQLKSVSGREETVSTIQLDFAMSERMGLSYVGSDGKEHRPLIIHRAPLGSHERLVAFLLESFGGAFPIWLSPEQVRVVPVGPALQDFAEEIVQALREELIRADMDRSEETLQKKVRAASVARVPCIAVVGERERANRSVSLRRRGSKDQAAVPLDRFIEWLRLAIQERKKDQDVGWP